ncbi:MAG: nucleoside 2-deoxyribosyltransferase [Acidobacteria bacterium]|nr:nucleoside 2-deoxyribosyltransferase [Acidobacteriota bacterium]MBV9475820.1 nucleoside 2-deoxyribosyltransferase [Acidobacteriota bacterium]
MLRTIYFSGAISGGRADVALYRRLVSALEAEGHRVLAGAVAAEDVGAGGEMLTPDFIFARDLGWLDDADLVVAEVSMPSTGVGYELAYARHRRGIPVIALYRPAHTTRCSAMVAGDPGIVLLTYEIVEELLPRLLESIRRAAGYSDRLP